MKQRVTALIRALPPAQRVGIAVAVAVLLMAAVPFVQWITTPSYTLLYAGMDDQQLAEVTAELEANAVPYRLEGSRVLVPRDRLHRTRATLAEAGVSASPAVPGYELLDEQALGVSDFRQRVDLQRAVEGELGRTLTAMDAVDTATVRLVLPEDRLFTEQQTPASASVLLRPRAELSAGQVEAITLLVSSAVEGLETDQITVADTQGRVLHAPGDGTVGGTTDRQHRRTRQFEQALATDLTQLLQRATDAPASAVVRATLDFDESETQIETFEEGGVPLREQSSEERFEGTQPLPGGIVGVDGGPVEAGTGEGSYEREEATREFGVGRTTTRTVQAPGTIERLHVAVVVDDGAPLADAELRELVGTAAGVDPERGDQVAITRVATPPLPEAAPAADELGLVELLQRIVALAVLLVIALALFLMSRRRRGTPVERVVPATVHGRAELGADEPAGQGHQQARPQPQPEVQTVREEVAELVERQPEEIATLLRGWLADRRSNA